MEKAYYDNAPVPKVNNAWNKKLHAYVESVYTENKNFAGMIRNFMDFCRIKDGRLLEIGCGSGWFRRYARDIEYVGLEVLVRKDVDLNFPFVVGFGETLPFKDESFDHILILATLDHVFDPAKVINESFKVLKKGGGIYILNSVELPGGIRKIFVYAFLLAQKVIFFDYRSIKRNFKKIVLKKDDEYHTFEFTASGFEEMLSKAGFSGISRRYFLNICFIKGRKPLK